MSSLSPEAQPTGLAPRLVAWRVLEAVGDGAYADLALERELKRQPLPPRDRALATELAYGAIRQRRQLDAWLDRYGKVPLQMVFEVGVKAAGVSWAFNFKLAQDEDGQPVLNENVAAFLARMDEGMKLVSSKPNLEKSEPPPKKAPARRGTASKASARRRRAA